MIVWLASLLLVAAATPVPAAAPAPAPARVVVVVGYNGGAADERPALSFADDDAARLFLELAPGATRAWLLTTFDKESSRRFADLTDIARAPTKQALAGVLGEAFWVLRQEHDRGRATELVFAFAGHGDVDDGGQGFVVFADGAFSRRDLAQQVLTPSPADLNHVIVDACSSYFFVKSRGGSDATDGNTAGVPLTATLLNDLQDELSPAVAARTGMVVSTSQAAEVHESRALSSGVFSYLLRSALAGGGDIDHDGRVEYGEAAAFIASATSNLSDPRTRLSIFAEAPLQRPHSALIDLRGGTDVAWLAVDEAAHVRLLDPLGQPWAEVNASGPLYLSLQGQPFFTVQRFRDDVVEEAVLAPRGGGAWALSSLDFAPVPVVARGGVGPFAALFSSALDDGFARGFWASSSSLAPAAGNTRFVATWAPGRAPPARVNVATIGIAVVGGAAVVGAGAVAALVGNQLAFAALDESFQRTGQLDPAKTIEVERWRNTATTLTVGSLGLGLVGSAVLAWSLTLDDRELVLPW